MCEAVTRSMHLGFSLGRERTWDISGGIRDDQQQYSQWMGHPDGPKKKKKNGEDGVEDGNQNGTQNLGYDRALSIANNKVKGMAVAVSG